jgi:hypothetical protein
MRWSETHSFPILMYIKKKKQKEKEKVVNKGKIG